MCRLSETVFWLSCSFTSLNVLKWCFHCNCGIVPSSLLGWVESKPTSGTFDSLHLELCPQLTHFSSPPPSVSSSACKVTSSQQLRLTGFSVLLEETEQKTLPKMMHFDWNSNIILLHQGHFLKRILPHQISDKTNFVENDKKNIYIYISFLTLIRLQFQFKVRDFRAVWKWAWSMSHDSAALIYFKHIFKIRFFCNLPHPILTGFRPHPPQSSSYLIIGFSKRNILIKWPLKMISIKFVNPWNDFFFNILTM